MLVTGIRLTCGVLLTLGLLPLVLSKEYEPNWKSIDSRPLPSWFDEAKFGIFMHWGVYSVPAYGSEWFWRYWRGGSKSYVDFMQKNYPPGYSYADFAKDFKAEFYDSDEWADLLKDSGAKYVVLTSKHHDGYCLWPTKVSFNWNSKDVGPRRDLVGELATSIRSRTDLRFGLYHSLFEWYNQMYLDDMYNLFLTKKFVEGKTLPEMYELVNLYKPDIFWSDGTEGPAFYFNSTHFLAWLYNESPVKDYVVTNDRWGAFTFCRHGGFYTCHDRYNPGILQSHKWENAMTVDKRSWGYRRDARLSDYFSIEELIATLAGTISCGGNLLMNVGPTADGRIIPVYEERLRQMGSWLKVNGEAVYASKPWTHQNDTLTPNIWYTCKTPATGTVVYAFVFKWPGSSLTLGAASPSNTTQVSLLGYHEEFNFTTTASGGMQIDVPAIHIDKMPCQWAWVFKLEGLENRKSTFKGYKVNSVNKDKESN